VVERTIACYHGMNRLRIRWQRRDDIHEAFLALATCIIRTAIHKTLPGTPNDAQVGAAASRNRFRQLVGVHSGRSRAASQVTTGPDLVLL
jgi:hypothetical protein